MEMPLPEVDRWLREVGDRLAALEQRLDALAPIIQARHVHAWQTTSIGGILGGDSPGVEHSAVEHCVCGASRHRRISWDEAKQILDGWES